MMKFSDNIMINHYKFNQRMNVEQILNKIKYKLNIQIFVV